MADDEVKDPAGTVRCSCGVMVPVPAASVGREMTCPSCSVAFKAVWALDSKTREKILTRVAAKGGAIRIPVGSHQLICSCGQVQIS